MNKIYRNLRYDWPLHFVLLLTNWFPDNTPFLRLRGGLARLFLGSCGKNLRLGRNISFYNPSVISIGNDVYIANGCWFMGGEIILVGDEVIFGPYCVVVSSAHTRSQRSYRYGEPRQMPIKINRGCWLSAHVTVTGGSTIEDGTLIAAGAIVNGEIPSDVVAGGMPARALKKVEDGQ